MSDVFKIADILVSHAVKAHGDEIAIIAYSGSYARGTASSTSDLDIFYIPDDRKAASLSSQFVLEGLPYDFWPVSWKLADDIANASSHRPWAVSASLIADAKVLYHRSQQDLDRFNALKVRIAELIKPESRNLMIQRALEEYKTTSYRLEQIRLGRTSGDVAGMHWACWNFINSAMNSLALINQTYFTKGWGANLSQALAMKKKPEGLEWMFKEITQSNDRVARFQTAERLAREVRDILVASQASMAEPFDSKDEFKDVYPFIFEYVNKIISACGRGDATSAGFAAFSLQEELCRLMNEIENGFYGSDFNLLGEYSGAYERAGFPDLLESASCGDLARLSSQVKRLDEKARKWFKKHSLEMGLLNGEEELRGFLNKRDPVKDDA